MHICITSVLFDKKPEGICTGRLIRALLDRGHRVTLLTTPKSDAGFEHANLRKIVVSHRPRYPRWLFSLIARMQGGINNNFYMWSRAVARHDFQGDVPDIFYGRAWPHASLVPAYELAQRYKRPLLLHFSDPFPAPNEDIRIEPRFMSDLQRMLDAADLITFTNQETIVYQKKFTPFDEEHAFVLNHIAPPPMFFGEPGTPGHFYHVGGVGPSRSPVPLLDGFALHLEQHPDSELYFVGALEKYISPEIQQRGLTHAVHVLPFTRDVRSMFHRAGVLISIDTQIGTPIFTPTKIVEYLMTDRPVLAMTPPHSPVSKLVARSPETALAVTDYSPQAVATGLDNILAYPWDESAYKKRLEGMHDFSAAAVVDEFEQVIEQYCLL